MNIMEHIIDFANLILRYFVLGQNYHRLFVSIDNNTQSKVEFYKLLLIYNIQSD